MDRRQVLGAILGTPVALLGAAQAKAEPKVWHRRMPNGEGYRAQIFYRGELVEGVMKACPEERWFEIKLGPKRLAADLDKIVYYKRPELPPWTHHPDEIWVDEERGRLHRRVWCDFEIRDKSTGAVLVSTAQFR